MMTKLIGSAMRLKQVDWRRARAALAGARQLHAQFLGVQQVGHADAAQREAL
jgi:hypothetical protein